MTRNTGLFLTAFALSVPLWAGLNVFSSALEDFFFWRFVAKDPSLLAASSATTQLEAQFEKRWPLAQKDQEPLELQARGAVSLYVSKEGGSKVLFEQQSTEPFPVASITKLMTALTATTHYPLRSPVKFSRQAVAEPENFGQFSSGEEFVLEEVLYSMLMESSNDAAAAVAERMGKREFVAAMNELAGRLQLESASFANPSGLDPDRAGEGINEASAEDVAKLAEYLLRETPLIFNILGQKEYDLYTLQGTFHHRILTTNELLIRNGWPTKVVAGKTGWTPEAKGNLLLVLESPKDRGYLINVVLGADDRFHTMQQLVDWVFESYNWKTPIL